MTMKTTVPRRFVLEAIDDTTECIDSEATFVVDDTAEFCRIVGISAGEFDSGAAYDLQAHQVVRLKSRFKIPFEPESRVVRLRHWRPHDELPYKIHTGRELALMLAGTKPLAYFTGQYPPAPAVEEIPERLFDPFVEKGRFVKREYVMLACFGGPALQKAGLRTRIVMYALSHQEWRINAMTLLMDSASKSGWNEGFERAQGSLLGYEAWQNDIFIEKIYRPIYVKR
jgi:hypothetical protein